jgi:hypothetical protein
MAEATNFAPTPENNGQTGVRAEYFDNPNLHGAPTLVRTEQHINYGRDARFLPGAAAFGALDGVLHAVNGGRV